MRLQLHALAYNLANFMRALTALITMVAGTAQGSKRETAIMSMIDIVLVVCGIALVTLLVYRFGFNR